MITLEFIAKIESTLAEAEEHQRRITENDPSGIKRPKMRSNYTDLTSVLSNIYMFDNQHFNN